MGWVSVCLLGILLTGARMHPLEEEISEGEDIEEFFVNLFVEDGRSGRNLEEELDNNIEEVDTFEKNIAGETSEVNPEKVARFNNYMDAVFRRMNAALRAKLMDPMELNLNQKEKKSAMKERKPAVKEKKDGKKRVERDAIEIGEVEDKNQEKDADDLVDRMGAAEEKKKKKKGNNKEMKDKKNKNKNKTVNKDKDTVNKNKGGNKKGEKNKGEKNKGEKNKNKYKGGNKEKDPKVKAQNKAERQKKREEKRAMKKKEKSARKALELSRGKRTKQSKEKHDKNNKKSVEEGKAMGSLSGIATLRRSGDVTVQDEETHIVVTSVFTVGPLQLEVSKSLGHGKARTVKTAKATTDVMTGVMVLKVKPDGSAHVKKVVFKKPEHVDVKGSISEKKERSENILKNSFNRSRPLAAQKILKTARYVLKGSSNPDRS